MHVKDVSKRLSATTAPPNVLGVRSCDSPVQSLGLFCYLQLLALLFYGFVSLASFGSWLVKRVCGQHY